MMKRAEEVMISIFIALACPITLFVLFWWSISALRMADVIKVQETTVIYASLLGLGIGILFNILYLKEIRTTFYDIGYKFLIPLYFFWSAIALAFSMGTPIGNFLLGTLAGLYFGRRLYYEKTLERDLAKRARIISVFTTAVTGIESLFIGFLGLRERLIIEFVGSRFSLDPAGLFGPLGVGIVVGIAIIVMLTQYIFTHIAFRTARKVGKR